MEPLKNTPADDATTRRQFIQVGTAALAVGAVAGSPPRKAESAEAGPNQESTQEWRNKQPGMAYRRLGRTGMMISEVVCGGDPITPANYKHVHKALDMGLNYLDMAPAYNDGGTETAFGMLLKESPGLRDKVFMTTKVSDFNKVRDHMYQDVLKSLPETRQKAIRDKARQMCQDRGVEAPGYFLTYFPGQPHSIESAYIRIAMLPEFGSQVEGSPELRKTMVESLEGSLKRTGTDHFDLLMCPHGANAPEELTPELADVFKDLKSQGKVRYLGTTSHNDPAGVLRKAADLGHYDAVMMAYNVINAGYLDQAIRHAASKDVGMIAMKTAHSVATHHKELQPIPEWRIAKVDRVVPGDMKPPLKAYLWALQNPRIAAVISNLWDETFVKENLALAGKTVELHSA